MATESTGWLKFLFHETLYVVDDPVHSTDTKSDGESVGVGDVDDLEPTRNAKSGHRPLLVALEGAASQEDRQLLSNILKSINTDLSGIHLLELDDKSPVLSQAHLEVMPHSTAILFGKNIQHHMHRNEGLYSIEHYDTYHIMQVDDLSTLRQFRLKKKALWQALQKLFEI